MNDTIKTGVLLSALVGAVVAGGVAATATTRADCWPPRASNCAKGPDGGFVWAEKCAVGPCPTPIGRHAK